MAQTTDDDNRVSITSQQSSQFSFVQPDDSLDTKLSPYRSVTPLAEAPTMVSGSGASLVSPTRRAGPPVSRITTGVIGTPPTIIRASPTRITHAQTPPSIVSNRQPGTPSSQLSRIDALVLENEELRNLLLHKDQYIRSLEEELFVLKNKGFDDNALSSHAEVEKKDVDVVLPPRSLNRARVPPTLHLDTEQQLENKEYVSDSQYQETVDDETSRMEGDDTVHESIDDTIQHEEPALEERLNPALFTPLSSNSNIDWNAAMQALSMSPENVQIHTPEMQRYSQDYFDKNIKNINSSGSPLKKLSDDDLVNEEEKSHISPRVGSTSTVPLVTPQNIIPPTPPRRPEFSQRAPSATSTYSQGIPPVLSKSTILNNNSDVEFNNKSPERYPNSSYAPSPTSSQNQQSFTVNRGANDPPLLIEPTQLNTISPQVISTLAPLPKTVKKKSNSDPDFSIVIGLFDYSSNKEIWRIKKTLSKIKSLNDEISRILLGTQFGVQNLLMVPDKSNFMINTPQKVDLRRIELDTYFRTLFSLPMASIPGNYISQVSYLITRFISGDLVNLLDESNLNVLKHGWLLMKRLKGLKYSWKVKYCELDVDGGVFKCENNGGFEVINLQNAQIGRQQDSGVNSSPGNSGTSPALSSNSNENDDKTYRHAFVIMEAKKKNSGFNKHIFCAETDNERDIWVNFLIQAVDECNDNHSITTDSLAPKSIETGSLQGENSLISIEYNDSLKSPAGSPIKGSFKTSTKDEDKELKRAKKRSFFPFSKKLVVNEFESYRQQQQQQQQQEQPCTPGSDVSNIERSLESMNISSSSYQLNQSHRIFGNELTQVFKLASDELFDVKVPSILSHCIKYLIKNDAIYEEGIFRLNGSSSLIKKLKLKFEEELVVNFEELEPRPDINSIAGLLKLWFREIPGDVIPSEVSYQLERIVDTGNNEERLSNWKHVMLSRVPEVNRNVIFGILKFLNMIIDQQEYNKMSLRNLSIVFSPTLNISNDVLMEMLVNYEYLFSDGGEVKVRGEDVNVSNF